jgi:hypothetical protein
MHVREGPNLARDTLKTCHWNTRNARLQLQQHRESQSHPNVQPSIEKRGQRAPCPSLKLTPARGPFINTLFKMVFAFSVEMQ